MSVDNKKTRVITRIGDIFCVTLKEYKVFFQFIAVDTSFLNSETIRVFMNKYPHEYVYDASEVVKDKVCFYSHTSLRAGLKQGLWTKVGHNKNIGDLTGVLFRNTSAWSPQCLKSHRWWVGGINGEYTMIGELTEDYRKITHMGWVVPPIDVVDKIIYGEYQGVMPY